MDCFLGNRREAARSRLLSGEDRVSPDDLTRQHFKSGKYHKLKTLQVVALSQTVQGQDQRLVSGHDADTERGRRRTDVSTGPQLRLTLNIHNNIKKT